MPCSLVLAAHGSTAAENSNQPLFDLAKEVEQRNVFDAVSPAFLNGQPLMSNVFDILPPGIVVVVPVMTSEGYYLTKLPEKFKENSDLMSIMEVFISRVVGLHEEIPSLVADQIRQDLKNHSIEASETTIIIVGHGTKRNPNSCTTTIELANNVNDLLGESAPQIETAFLDQDPSIDVVARSIETPNTIVIPFLISRGPHSTEDVPQAFGLPSGPDITFPLVHQTESGKCICNSPVGMMPGIADICIKLAREAREKKSVMEGVIV